MTRTGVRGTQIKDGVDGVDLTIDVTNTLPAGNGGTGNATNTLGALMIGNGTGAVLALSPGADGTTVIAASGAWTVAAAASGGEDFAFFAS